MPGTFNWAGNSWLAMDIDPRGETSTSILLNVRSNKFPPISYLYANKLVCLSILKRAINGDQVLMSMQNEIPRSVHF